MGVLALLVIGHSVLIGLWVLPENPVSDTVGRHRLSGYVNPWFEQSWAVFAPIPRRVDESLAIRAVRTDPRTGEKQVTRWFDITAHDDRRTILSVNPIRMKSATHRLAGNINNATATFNLAQQDLVQDGVFDSTRPAFRKALLDPAVGPAAARPSAVAAYLRNDEMAVRFATMYARARWGGQITQVQYRVARRDVPVYARRSDFGGLRGDVKTFGWRIAIAGSRAAQAGFDAYAGGDGS